MIAQSSCYNGKDGCWGGSGAHWSTSSLLNSLGGSTRSKTLCMPGDGESRSSKPRFSIIFFSSSPLGRLLSERFPSINISKYYHKLF